MAPPANVQWVVLASEVHLSATTSVPSHAHVRRSPLAGAHCRGQSLGRRDSGHARSVPELHLHGTGRPIHHRRHNHLHLGPDRRLRHLQSHDRIPRRLRPHQVRHFLWLVHRNDLHLGRQLGQRPRNRLPSHHLRRPRQLQRLLPRVRRAPLRPRIRRARQHRRHARSIPELHLHGTGRPIHHRRHNHLHLGPDRRLRHLQSHDRIPRRLRPHQVRHFLWLVHRNDLHLGRQLGQRPRNRLPSHHLRRPRQLQRLLPRVRRAPLRPHI